MSWRFKLSTYSRSFSLGLLLSLSESIVFMPRSLAQIPSEKGGVGERSCTDEQIDAMLKLWHFKVSSQHKLAACGESAVPHLIQILRISPDVWSRQNVARFFGELKSAENTKALIDTIKTDQSELVRQDALTSLVQIGGPDVAKVLLDTLATDKSEYVGKSVVNFLGKIGGSEVTDRLIQTLNTNQNAEIKARVVKILINNPSEAGIQALEQNKAIVLQVVEQEIAMEQKGMVAFRDNHRDSCRESWRGRGRESGRGHCAGASASQTTVQATQKFSQPPLACKFDWFAKIWPACK
jgi:hypothetical protein